MALVCWVVSFSLFDDVLQAKVDRCLDGTISLNKGQTYSKNPRKEACQIA